ncbi:MAG: iron-sulfur cluster assembly scaffold protein [Erythrobacter sp.]|nr:iron-sulfur cluster assembly scaffold protein [Erythrobacter sp.]
MTPRPRGALYSPALLGLAVELAEYPYDKNASLIGEARSRSCGSTLAVSFEPGFGNLGLKVTACAVGQASAAIFARHAEGRDPEEIAQVTAAIEEWLSADGPQPEWPDIAMLEAARAYPARHGAILLPWKAALDALSNDAAGR